MMPFSVFVIVLVAAVLHAAWNAIVKGSGDKVFGMTAVAGGGAVLAAIALPFVPQPASASWAFVAASVGVHIAYFIFVARSYELTDMSQAYPLMRGTAPLLVALGEPIFLGQHLAFLAIVGIALICGGILTMASSAQPGAGLVFALLNAFVIATYTLIDGEGVRRAGTPVAYTLWVFMLSGLPFLFFIVMRRGATVLTELRSSLVAGLVGGAGTVGAYILVLWAMTRAPVALVAALRETAILFGLAISAFILGEVVGRKRIAAACIIVAGIATLKLA